MSDQDILQPVDQDVVSGDRVDQSGQDNAHRDEDDSRKIVDESGAVDGAVPPREPGSPDAEVPADSDYDEDARIGPDLEEGPGL